MTLIAGARVPLAPSSTPPGPSSEEEKEHGPAFIWAVIVINAWNRLAVTARTLPGEYRPG